MADQDLAAEQTAPGSSRSSIVARNRKAARTRVAADRGRSPETVQARLERRMAGAWDAQGTIKVPSLGEIRARVDAAILRQAQDDRAEAVK